MPHYAGVDVILGTDFMLPGGVRLDLFRSTMKNPEEVVVPLIKSQREVDEQSSAKHVPGNPNDALDVPAGSVVEFKLQRNCPSWITHDLWVRRTNSLVPTVRFDRSGRLSRVKVTNVSNRRVWCPAHFSFVWWVPNDDLPLDDGYVSISEEVNASSCPLDAGEHEDLPHDKHRAWEPGENRSANEGINATGQLEDQVDEVGPAQWLELLRQQAAGMRALSARPELARGTFLDGMGGVTEPVYVTIAGLQEMDDEITDSTTDDPLTDLHLRYAASANALVNDIDGGNGDEFEYEGNEIHFEDYAHELAFLPDLTVPASMILDYDAPNVKNPTLDPIGQLKLVETLRRHEEIRIASGNALPPPAYGVVCDIDVRGHAPIKQRARRIPLKYLRKLYELLKGLLEAGLIAFSSSPWASPIVIVLKKNGQYIRLCIDYKMVNAITLIMEYAMPLVDDLMTEMESSLWFCSLDTASGFGAIMMTMRARWVSAFVCALGHFEWLRMPFGLKNAPMIYQRMIDNALWGYVQPKGGWEAFAQRMKDAEAKALALRKAFMAISRRSPTSARPALQTKYEADHRGALTKHDPLMELINSPAADMFTVGEPDQSKLVPVFHRRSFVDDICFGGATFDECLEPLDRLLARFAECRIRVSFTKSVFVQHKVEFLSHEVTNDGIRANSKKLTAIAELPFPSSKKGMQSFLGALNYYGRFILGLAVYGAVLYQLKDEDFVPGGNLSVARGAFEALRRKVAEAPILRHFDGSKDVYIMMYANEWALSSTLMQMHDEVLHPVRFCGRVLKENELNYHPAEKEVLALLQVLKVCYTLLAGKILHVYTRFSTLEWVFQSKSLFGRSVQFAVFLPQWHLKIKRVRERDIEFAKLLQSSITPFVPPDEAVAPLAPPPKGSATVRMAPHLLYASITRDYDGYEQERDKRRAHRRPALERRARQRVHTDAKDADPHHDLAAVVGVAAVEPEPTLDELALVALVAPELRLLVVRGHLEHIPEGPETPAGDVQQRRARVVVAVREREQHGQQREQHPEALDAPDAQEPQRVHADVLEARVLAALADAQEEEGAEPHAPEPHERGEQRLAPRRGLARRQRQQRHERVRGGAREVEGNRLTLGMPPPPMDDAVLLEAAAAAAAGFDAFAWVEEALAARAGDASALAPLGPQLALRSQALAQTLHASLQHVALSGATLQTRLQALQQAAAPLARHLDAAHEACASGSVAAASPAGQDLRDLVTLHEAKRRLQSCSQALVEAARWGRNVRACFAAVEDPALLGHAARITKAGDAAVHLADRVREMQASLDVLKDLPGAWDRKQTMERLCAQIEAAVQPRLASRLRDEDLGDVAPLRWCLDVLGSVNRAHLVRDEFCRSRPAHVHRVWYAYSEEMQPEADEKDAGDAFASWLDNFYGDVLRMLQRESRNARDLFGADQLIGVLLVLLHNTLEPLTKPFRDRLERSGPSSSDFQLGRLLSCFHTTRGFAAQLVQLVRSLETELGVSLADCTDAAASAEGILRIVFEPYRLYFTDYTRFTSEALTDALLRLVPVFNAKKNEALAEDEMDQDAADTAPLEDFSQRLEEASEAAWVLIDENLQQCYEFTGGAAFPEAVEAIGAAVQQFTLALSATIPAIRKYCKAEPASQVEGVSGVPLVISPDWSQFHASLALLKVCGSLESQLCALDSRVRVRMREQLAQFFGETSGSSSPRGRRKKTHESAGITLADLVDPTKLVAAVSKSWLHDEDPIRQSQFHQFEMELLDHASSFETAGSRSSLENAFVASRGAQEVCVQAEWARLGQILHLTPPELASCQRIFGADSKPATAEPAPTATEFVDLWTAAVASGTLAAFLRTACSISLLSEMGGQQLAADLGYFHNVLSAVGGEGNFIVDDLRRALEMDLQAHFQHVEELRADRDSPENQALAKINDCIAAMRQRALDQPRRLSSASSSSAADQAVSCGKNTHLAGLGSSAAPDDDSQQQQQEEKRPPEKQERDRLSDLAEKKGNQDEDGSLKAVVNTDATLAILQPRINRLAYLHTPGNANLEALARSLGPKL
ncbi:unnamed protein product [Phytophthora fragariaefolia]|uniref:Unnamed protein product n=1 Tax=Phytophthora fragariaefolia TaxID=1490495 RepID=A0A9W7CYY1_9STRA|nr:unnamed protein product [Phytophthora fragariaefolia]